MNVSDISEYLGVTRSRVHQLAPTPGFPAPVDEMWTREWDPAEIEAWAETEWWDTKPWRARPVSGGTQDEADQRRRSGSGTSP